MLSMEEREKIAQRLERLQSDLRPFLSQTVKELPKNLRERIYAERAFGPVTTSGLERIAPLTLRIGWAIDFMRDPNFGQSKPAISTASAPLQPSEINKPTEKPTEIEQVLTPPPLNHLDFGPFDPRIGSGDNNSDTANKE